jgi:hypothetical protein
MNRIAAVLSAASLAATPACIYQFNNPVAAQANGTIGGQIRIADAGGPGPSLADVSVRLLWTGLSIGVDPTTGSFHFLGLPNGTYTLSYGAPGPDGGLPLLGQIEGIVLPQQSADQAGGQTADAIDLGTLDLVPATRVSGCVNNSDAGMVVAAFGANDAGLFESFSSPLNAGQFTLDLPAGSHQLWISSDTAFHATMFDGGPGQTQSLDCVDLQDPDPGPGQMTMSLVLGEPGLGACAPSAAVESVIGAQGDNVEVASSDEPLDHTFTSQVPCVGYSFQQPLFHGVQFDFACFLRRDAGVDLGVLALSHLPALLNRDTTLGQVTWLPPSTYLANGLPPPPPTPTLDAGPDAGPDGGIDAGPDAGPDAGLDAGIDAGPDAGVDGGVDAGVDAGAANDWVLYGSAPFDGGVAVPANDVLVGMSATSPQGLPGHRLAWLYDGTVWATDDFTTVFAPALSITSGANGLVGGADSQGSSVLVMSNPGATAPGLLRHAIYAVGAGWVVSTDQVLSPRPGDRTFAFAAGDDGGVRDYVAGVDSSGGLLIYEDHGNGPTSFVSNPVVTGVSQVAISGCAASGFANGAGLCVVYTDVDGGLEALQYDPSLNVNGATIGVVGAPVNLAAGASEPSIVPLPLVGTATPVGVSWVSSRLLIYGQLSDFACGPTCLALTSTNVATPLGASLLNLKGSTIAAYVDAAGNAGSLWFGMTPALSDGFLPAVSGPQTYAVSGFNDGATTVPWAGFIQGTAAFPDYTLYQFIVPASF